MGDRVSEAGALRVRSGSGMCCAGRLGGVVGTKESVKGRSKKGGREEGRQERRT